MQFISSSRVCSDGVPQGSILGPLSFSLCLNDLPEACPDIKIQMYADDTMIYANGKTREQVELKVEMKQQSVKVTLFSK